MGTDFVRPAVRDVRTYEPGPSGTAVAGLIIALIALAVALYAAFAPRQVVNEGARAVMAPLEKAVAGHPQTVAPGQRSLTADEIRHIAAVEAKQQIAALQKDLRKLRAEIQSAGGAAPSAGQPAAAKPGGSH
jgi:hypothetical protein